MAAGRHQERAGDRGACGTAGATWLRQSEASASPRRAPALDTVHPPWRALEKQIEGGLRSFPPVAELGVSQCRRWSPEFGDLVKCHRNSSNSSRFTISISDRISASFAASSRADKSGRGIIHALTHIRMLLATGKFMPPRGGE
jgi:hypothetical protein